MPNKVRASSVLTTVFSVFLAASSSITNREEQVTVIDDASLVKSDQMSSLQQEPQDLHGQMLAGKKFKKAKLRAANLRTAMLAGADFRGADLEYADLYGAMLVGANLSGANLVNANFEEANLLGTQLEGARIDGANFKKTTFLTQDQVDEACGKPRTLPEGLKAPKPC
jgi:uncharacterized protein YjbI with pentapeptide repeats